MHSNNRGDSVFGSQWCSGDKAKRRSCQSRRVDSSARTLFVSFAVLPHSPCGFSQRAPKTGLVKTAKVRTQHFGFRRLVRVAVFGRGTPGLRVEFCTQTGREGVGEKKSLTCSFTLVSQRQSLVCRESCCCNLQKPPEGWREEDNQDAAGYYIIREVTASLAMLGR